MPQFRKKPVVFEARQFVEVVDGSKLCSWCGGTNEISPQQIQIPTLEGVMTADLGDWIAKGTKGEFYPIKPDIFANICDPENQPENQGCNPGDRIDGITSLRRALADLRAAAEEVCSFDYADRCPELQHDIEVLRALVGSPRTRENQ